MKKTFTININGIIFHIDEDAFEQLKQYLDSIRNHFEGTSEQDEIVLDIESRIAELLQEQLSNSKQVINKTDIDRIISIMGTPNDFQEADEPAAEAPKANTKTASKRLFRDPDNKYLGGVAGGLAAYFHTDPLWWRIGFVLASILYGFGPLTYLIIWLVVPEARTTAEKLEMRGKKVNISNMEHNIREEMDRLGHKMNSLTQEARKAYQKKKGFSKDYFQPASRELIRSGKVLIRILAILLGLPLALLGLLLLAAWTTIAAEAMGYPVLGLIFLDTFPLPEIISQLFASQQQLSVLLVCLSIVIVIPLLSLIYNSIRMVFNFKTSGKWLGFTSFSIWLIGLLLLFIFGLRTGMDIQQSARQTAVYNLTPDSTNTLTIKNIPTPTDASLLLISNQQIEDYYVQGSDWELAFVPDFYIVKGNTTELQLNRKARGRNHFEANERARAIVYNFNEGPAELNLQSLFRLKAPEVWRGHELNLILQVKPGTQLDFTTLKKYRSRNRPANDQMMRRYAGRKWLMTNNGLEEVSPLD